VQFVEEEQVKHKRMQMTLYIIWPSFHISCKQNMQLNMISPTVSDSHLAGSIAFASCSAQWMIQLPSPLLLLLLLLLLSAVHPT
jgi:hypothetical protein